MSIFTNFVNGVGVENVPVQSGGSPDGTVALTPHDYFLLSRVDGTSTLKAIRSVSGMSEDAFCEAMVKLLAAGLVMIQGVEHRAVFEIYVAASLGAEAPAPSASVSASGAHPSVRGTPEPERFARTPSTRTGPERFDRSASTRTPSIPRRSDSGSRSIDTRRPPVAARQREVFETGSKSQVRVNKTVAPKLGVDILPPNWPIPFDQFTFDPIVMASGTAIDDEQKQVVLYYHYHLRRVTYYQLLGLTPKAGRKDVKLAYFRLSKTFHPDRWYRKDVGAFGEMIEDIFKWLNRAYGVLSSPKKRKGYNKLLDRGYIGEWELDKSSFGPRGAAPTTNPGAASSGGAAEVNPEVKRTASLLAAKARRAEASGDWVEAADLYGRVVQVAPTPDLRIRLAECMLKANVNPSEIDPQVSAARESGADDVSTSLVEAEVARRRGQLDRAEACFRHVLEVDPNNAAARLGLDKMGTSPGSTR